MMDVDIVVELRKNKHYLLVCNLVVLFLFLVLYSRLSETAKLFLIENIDLTSSSSERLTPVTVGIPLAIGLVLGLMFSVVSFVMSFFANVYKDKLQLNPDIFWGIVSLVWGLIIFLLLDFFSPVPIPIFLQAVFCIFLSIGIFFASWLPLGLWNVFLIFILLGGRLFRK